MAKTKFTKSVSFPADQERDVRDFIDMQSNFSDTVYYLLQKEIAENGVRNLQQWIPQERTVDSVRSFLNYTHPTMTSPSTVPLAASVVSKQNKTESEEVADATSSPNENPAGLPENTPADPVTTPVSTPANPVATPESAPTSPAAASESAPTDLEDVVDIIQKSPDNVQKDKPEVSQDLLSLYGDM